MATSLLQVRVDDTLKEEAARIFDNLGIDTSTAVRMFLKRTVMENGIPFRMTLPKEPYYAERGYRAMLEIGEQSVANGLSNMSLEEINQEIDSSKKERKGANWWIKKKGYVRSYVVTPREMMDIVEGTRR